MENILEVINQIFIDILDDESISLSGSTTAHDIEDWDSLNHIQIIYSIEKHFGIKFSSTEIQNFKKVGDICLCVEAKLGK